MFVTIRLWQHLTHPPRRGYIYRHTVSEKPNPKRLVSIYQPLVDMFGTLGCGLLVSFVCCSLVAAPFGVFIFAAIILLVLFNGAIFGLPWGWMITGMIADRRERQVWDLLCVTPGGAAMTVWSLVTGCLHRENTFEDRYWRHRAIVYGVAGLGVLVALGSIATQRYSSDSLDTSLSVGIIAVGAASYVDYIQSVTLASLLAVWSALTTRNRFDAQLWFSIGYLAVQVMTYALTALIGYVGLPLLTDRTTVNIWGILLLLVIFGGVREVVLLVLVRLLSKHQNLNMLSELVTAARQ